MKLELPAGEFLKGLSEASLILKPQKKYSVYDPITNIYISYDNKSNLCSVISLDGSIMYCRTIQASNPFTAGLPLRNHFDAGDRQYILISGIDTKSILKLFPKRNCTGDCTIETSENETSCTLIYQNQTYNFENEGFNHVFPNVEQILNSQFKKQNEGISGCIHCNPRFLGVIGKVFSDDAVVYFQQSSSRNLMRVTGETLLDKVTIIFSISSVAAEANRELFGEEQPTEAVA